MGDSADENFKYTYLFSGPNAAASALRPFGNELDRKLKLVRESPLKSSVSSRLENR
jgi:hypothetical protein